MSEKTNLQFGMDSDFKMEDVMSNIFLHKWYL